MRARELGADGVELDVARCRSGEVIVFHDDDLTRLAGRPERVREQPLGALREVELAGGEQIPLLEEVIETVGTRMLINIELKSPVRRGLGHLGALCDDGLPEAVAALVTRHGLRQRALISSFDPTLLWRFRRTLSEVPMALLFQADSARPLSRAWAAPLLRPLALHPEALLVDALTLGQWRKRGYAINVWTVDDAHEIAYLAALGVDGLITNRPAEARHIVDGPVVSFPHGEV